MLLVHFIIEITIITTFFCEAGARRRLAKHKDWFSLNLPTSNSKSLINTITSCHIIFTQGRVNIMWPCGSCAGLFSFWSCLVTVSFPRNRTTIKDIREWYQSASFTNRSSEQIKNKFRKKLVNQAQSSHLTLRKRANEHIS